MRQGQQILPAQIAQDADGFEPGFQQIGQPMYAIRFVDPEEFLVLGHIEVRRIGPRDRAKDLIRAAKVDCRAKVRAAACVCKDPHTRWADVEIVASHRACGGQGKAAGMLDRGGSRLVGADMQDKSAHLGLCTGTGA